MIFEAVPNSFASMADTREIWSFGGIISDIMLVPFLQITIRYGYFNSIQVLGISNQITDKFTNPRAASRLLINRLIFQISTFLSAVESLPDEEGAIVELLDPTAFATADAEAIK